MDPDIIAGRGGSSNGHCVSPPLRRPLFPPALTAVGIWLVTAALAASPAAGQFYPTLPGEWAQSIETHIPPEYALSGPDARSYIDRFESLASMLAAAPVFQPPLGFQPRLHALLLPSAECQRDDTCAREIARGQVTLIFFYYFEQNGKPAWGGENNTSARIWVNDPAMAYSGRYELGAEGLPLPDGRHIVFQPSRTGEVAGFPLYDDRSLILTRNGQPVWIPVTREQFLDAMIRYRERDLAGAEETPLDTDAAYQDWLSGREERQKAMLEAYRAIKMSDPVAAEEFLRTAKENEEAMEKSFKSGLESIYGNAPSLQPLRDAVSSLRSELAQMAPAERASQAWLERFEGEEDLGASGLVPAGSPDARGLVAVNPDFFDKSLSRAEWQLITVDLDWFGPEEGIGNVRLREFLRTVDWRQVAGLLR